MPAPMGQDALWADAEARPGDFGLLGAAPLAGTAVAAADDAVGPVAEALGAMDIHDAVAPVLADERANAFPRADVGFPAVAGPVADIDLPFYVRDRLDDVHPEPFNGERPPLVICAEDFYDEARIAEYERAVAKWKEDHPGMSMNGR